MFVTYFPFLLLFADAVWDWGGAKAPLAPPGDAPEEIKVVAAALDLLETTDEDAAALEIKWLNGHHPHAPV